MKLIIASTNLHKVRELRAMLKNIKGLDVYSLLDFPTYVPPPETGSTFEENATLKALDAAKSLDKFVLADDSGIIVPALNGKPGIFSARYAGEKATDHDNRELLLKEMTSLNENERDAYFECCIVLANPDGVVKAVHGYCEGSIITAAKGGSGFGYDPIFIKHEYSKTLAELPEETKNKISHRRKAIDKIMPTLESLEEQTQLS